MKKFTLIVALFLGFFATQAQEANKFRFDFGLGYAIPKGGGGLLINLEPKWNIKDNMAVGFRYGGAALAREGGVSEDGTSAELEASFNGSYVGTFEYNFNNGSSSFAPFVGAGIGYYDVVSASFGFSVDQNGESLNDNSGAEREGKIGGLLRTGFDWGKFRLTAEYNLIPKTEIEFEGETVGDVKNGYLGISLGFFLGGGKWGQ